MCIPSISSAKALSVLRGAKSAASSPYFIFNFIVFFTYPFVRSSFKHQPLESTRQLFGQTKDFASWESYAAYTCLLSGFFNAYKGRSLEASISTLLTHAQMFVLVVSLTCDRIVLAQYLICFGVIFLLFPYPMYDWEEDLKPITPSFLLSEIACDDNEGVDVVVLYSGHHFNCRTLTSVFADLSKRYANDKIRFYRLDIGEFSAFAKHKKIDVEVSTVSAQLPTVILYVDGQEQGRLPIKKGGNVYKKDFTALDVINAFELDMRFTRSLSTKAKGGVKGPSRSNE